MACILFNTIWKVYSFTHTLKGYHTGVVSNVFVSVYGKDTALEWLALCFISCVLGGTAPWSTAVANFFDNNH